MLCDVSILPQARSCSFGCNFWLGCCRFLRDHARTIAGKSQLFINAYAKALEVIPRQLCDNAGFDATDVLNKLRQRHASKAQDGQNFGVDVNTGKQWNQLACAAHSRASNGYACYPGNSASKCCWKRNLSCKSGLPMLVISAA